MPHATNTWSRDRYLHAQTLQNFAGVSRPGNNCLAGGTMAREIIHAPDPDNFESTRLLHGSPMLLDAFGGREISSA